MCLNDERELITPSPATSALSSKGAGAAAPHPASFSCSGIFAATDNMVIVTRNPEKDKARKEGLPYHEWGHLHNTEVTVEKQRETGWEGTYKLTYDPKMYSYGKWVESAGEAEKREESGKAGSNGKAVKSAKTSPQFPLGVGGQY